LCCLSHLGWTCRVKTSARRHCKKPRAFRRALSPVGYRECFMLVVLECDDLSGGLASFQLRRSFSVKTLEALTPRARTVPAAVGRRPKVSMVSDAPR